MSAQTISPRIIFARNNLAGSEYIHLSGPESIGSFARENAYDGVEWCRFAVDVPATVVGQAAGRRTLPLESFDLNSRLAWSAQDVAPDADAHAEPRTVRDRLYGLPGVGRLAILEATQAAVYMKKMIDVGDQELKKERGDAGWKLKKIPGVFYPHPNPDVDASIRELAGAWADLAQPSDRLARTLGVGSLPALETTLLERRYGYYYALNGKAWYQAPYMLNTFTVRQRYEREKPGVVSNLKETLPDIVANTSAVQVELGVQQCTSSEPHIPTDQELRQVLSGNVTGELNDIFDGIRAGRSIAYIVARVAASSIVRVTGHAYMGDVRRHYQDIALSLRALCTPSSN